jgi:hypothetical protein
MDSVRVVTTLHKDGYELYGKKFIDTWVEFFPKDWKITYYAEKHTPTFDSRIEVLDFNDACLQWNDFYNHIQETVKPLVDKKAINRYRKALRWSFKMFTLLDALNNSTERYVIWLDSDVYANNSPEENWLLKIIEEKAIAGQLENAKGFPHIETGILIIDTKHQDITKIKKWIHQGYIGKEILKEPKPWDGIWMAKLFLSNTVDAKYIQIVTQNNVAKPFSSHSMKWLTHYVGDRKFDHTYSGRSGRTKESELI